MTWSCRYCTFDNDDDSDSTCSLCGMPGKRTMDVQKEQPKIGKESEIVDLTGTVNDKKNRSAYTQRFSSDSKSMACSNSITIFDESASSRKRKAPPPAGSNDKSHKLHSFFTKRAPSQKVDQHTLKPCAAAKSTSITTTHHQQQQTTNQYPHSFSYNLVAKRTPQQAQQDVQKSLESIFKLKNLRNLQPQAVDCALRLESQMIVMATGGGKCVQRNLGDVPFFLVMYIWLTFRFLHLCRSLCYQLPACLLGGVTIVISPLLALMQDQTEALNSKGIPAACVNSSQTETQNKYILERVVPSLFSKSSNSSKSRKESPSHSSPTPVLLYITPESIQTDRMKNVLQQLYKEDRLALFAVDEAHCLSSWGHDFRPAYRRLNSLRIDFPKTPCMALTATATKNVILDITKELSLQGCPLHVGSFDRPNIYYKVKYKDSMDNPIQDLIQIISENHRICAENRAPCSGIVYVHKREDTTMIASAISKAGISASGYHAGLKKDERLAVQEGWSNGKIQVAVATGTSYVSNSTLRLQ